MDDNFGLSSRVRSEIESILSSCPSITGVDIFGSRAMGNYKSGSDIDLVLYGSNLDENILFSLYIKLESSPLIPHHVDLVAWDLIENKDLRQHIEQFGRPYYNKKGT